MESESAISQILERLKERPHIKYTATADHLEIPAQDASGFSVWIHEHGNEYTVGYDDWHEEFTDKDEALNWFALGLSPDCRLQVTRRGTVDYKWQAFYFQDGEWVPSSITGLLFFPFWRRREQRILQNKLVVPHSGE